MVVSALISRSPSMLYFGQEVGERGDSNDAAFNVPMKMRTTQYDYWGVSTHQRWMNGGKFDGGKLTDAEQELRDFYSRLMTFSANNPALQGEYAEIHSHNRQLDTGYDDRLFSFVRWNDEEKLIIVSNFDDEKPCDFALEIPAYVLSSWLLADGRYTLDEQLFGQIHSELVISSGHGRIPVSLGPLESAVFRVR